jgi:hypothetical protein
MDKDHGRYCFDCTDRSGQKKSDTYRYVVNARGQARFLATDPSELAQNLIALSKAQRHQESTGRAASWRQRSAIEDREAVSDADRSATIRIDPQTHRVVSPDFDPRSAVYAVGAMTRSQIIDASMAHGISCSTSKIADNLLHILSRRR